jgi:two-component system response regulator DesR
LLSPKFGGMEFHDEQSVARKSAIPGRRIRTIVADDSPEFLRSFCAFLRSQPDLEIVGQASDGSEAVALAGVLQPDLAVLDLEMPGMDGLRAAELLRARFPALRIILVSVHDNFVGRESSRATAVDAFVSKGTLVQDWTQQMRKLFAQAGPVEDRKG